MNIELINQLQAQVMLNLEYYSNGNDIASIFWGLWLFPFGYLVFKSGFLPKILAILLMAGCFGYLINFTGSFLFPGYGETGISSFITKPGSLGEIGICLWLLIIGVKRQVHTQNNLTESEVASAEKTSQATEPLQRNLNRT